MKRALITISQKQKSINETLKMDSMAPLHLLTMIQITRKILKSSAKNCPKTFQLVFVAILNFGMESQEIYSKNRIRKPCLIKLWWHGHILKIPPFIAYFNANLYIVYIVIPCIYCFICLYHVTGPSWRSVLGTEEATLDKESLNKNKIKYETDIDTGFVPFLWN